MQNRERPTHPPMVHSGNQQLIMLNQLLQASQNMRHIDEMFAWLSDMTVRFLDVQVMQIWTNQASPRDPISAQLRAIASQDASLPRHIVNNIQVAEVVVSLLSKRRGLAVQPISGFFSSHQANLFRRYGLNYWFGYFLGHDALLPSAIDPFSPAKNARPFTVIVLLFVQRTPPQSLETTLSNVLGQLVPIAISRNLLLAPPTNNASQSLPVTDHLPRSSPPSLTELVPHRIKNTEATLSLNPFTNTPIIPDPKARQLYLAIDGQKSIADLLSTLQMNMQDMQMVLRILLNQKLIHLHDPKG